MINIKEQIHLQLMALVKDEIELVYTESPDGYDNIMFNLYDKFKELLDKYYIVSI